MSFAERVYALVSRIPRGQVASYGGVAIMLGRPRSARGVGHALRVLPDDSDVPWWRVINARGEISARGPGNIERLQRKLLEREGVRFDASGRIDWQRWGWEGESND
jgi:methylated-DNA-protein-cysteine methyltransferase-like protein